MNTKSFLLATLVGGITFFLLSFIFYGLIMADFFAVNAGSATGAMKETTSFLALFLGELAFGALYSYIFIQWANISTFSGGAKAGAIIGLLLGLGFDLISFATNNLMNLTASMVDAVWACVAGAITGGVIGWVIGNRKSSAQDGNGFRTG